MDYSNRLRSGSVARRRATDRDEIDMIKALERGLDLEEADMADDDSAASVEIGQFEQADAFTRSTGGGRRSGESSLPSFAVRQAGARVLQGRGGDHKSDQGSSRGSTASQNLGGGERSPNNWVLSRRSSPGGPTGRASPSGLTGRTIPIVPSGRTSTARNERGQRPNEWLRSGRRGNPFSPRSREFQAALHVRSSPVRNPSSLPDANKAHLIFLPKDDIRYRTCLGHVGRA